MKNEIIVRQIIFKGRKEPLMIGLSHPTLTLCLAHTLLPTSLWKTKWLNRSKEMQENITTLISNWSRPITQVTCSLVTNLMECKRRKKANTKIKGKEPLRISSGRDQLQFPRTPATDSTTHQTSRSDSVVSSLKLTYKLFIRSRIWLSAKVIHISKLVVPCSFLLLIMA